MKKKIAGYLAAAVASAWLLGLPARADDFELAMVIKETTNPYYNATLSGAQIAAKEIGGTAKNYGPTQSSPQAQIDIINNLADRHVQAIAVAPSDPNAVGPAMKRAAKLGVKVITFDADSATDARPFLVNMATTDSVGRFASEGSVLEHKRQEQVYLILRDTSVYYTHMLFFDPRSANAAHGLVRAVQTLLDGIIEAG